jgi:hypothetical protein
MLLNELRKELAKPEFDPLENDVRGEIIIHKTHDRVAP